MKAPAVSTMYAIVQNGTPILESNDGKSLHVVFHNLTGRNFQQSLCQASSHREYVASMQDLIDFNPALPFELIENGVLCEQHYLVPSDLI